MATTHWETVYRADLGRPGFKGRRVDIVALPDGRISGRVVNIRGKSLTGVVTLVAAGQQVVNP